MKGKTILLVVVILFFVSNSVYAVTASFQGLGDLSGGNFRSYATGVSADGSVVVGYSRTASGYEAFRWENGVMVGLGYLPYSYSESCAAGVSADGSVVVGYNVIDYGGPMDYEAFRWTQETGMVGLGNVPNSDRGSFAHGVSADGSVVVGGGGQPEWGGLGSFAFRWENNQMVNLGDLPGGNSWSYAYDVSSDGLVVVGWSWSSSGDEGFRWENGQMVGLGDLPGGGPGGEFFSSCAYGVSADGSVVVGASWSSSGLEAFHWTAETGMVGLGKLGSYSDDEFAFDCSADGSVIVGQSRHPYSSDDNRAFIWDAQNGMRDLRSVLINDYGLDLFDWDMYSAEAITDNGLTMVGYGSHWNQDLGMWCREGWIATIPEPTSAILMTLGATIITLCRRKR